MAATADRILAEARGEFARRGFAAARLQDIAERAGLTHPTLLYHFGSKERLYEAVIARAVHDWADTTRRAISTGLRGFDQVAALLEAGYEFFASHDDLVVIVRREALEGGGRLESAIADHMRPFLDDALAFLEREMAAGRLRPHDPAELMQLCYSALLTHFSDARFRARLFGADPPGDRFLASLTEILRAALEPR
ncbi:MAG TPA: TetR family transcriptional regulator [Solirubrobacteraceae bacterium]|jgi:TetR/AcrR family transcriptional regulator